MSKTHSQIIAMKHGEQFDVGPLFGNLSPDQITLTMHEKVDGDVFFKATYLGVILGVVRYSQYKWGWAK